MSSPPGTSTPAIWYRYGYYLRFAVLGWTTLALFPWVALLSFPALLGGLLVLTPARCLLLGLVVGLSLASLTAIVHFVTSHAPRTFQLVFRAGDNYMDCGYEAHAPFGLRLTHLQYLQHVPALSLFIAVSYATLLDTPQEARGAVSMVTLCLAAGYLAALLLLSPMLHTSGAWTAARATPALSVVRGIRPPGTVVDEVWSARRRAYLVLGFWSLAYLALYFARDSSAVSPLTLFVVIVTWLSWLLATFAFIVDRWLIPLLGLMIVTALVLPDLGRADHVFEVAPLPESVAPPRATAIDLLAPPPGPEPVPLVFVAASGGGIQAGAWTAHVLTHIARTVPWFSTRVRLISAVSGGSVGTMFYLNDAIVGRHLGGPQESRAINPQESQAIRMAERSALEGVAVGIAYWDLWRPLRSWLFARARYDRGLALEQSWARDCEVCVWPLSALREQRRQNQLPAIVFNATAVEAGRRVFLGTVLVPTANLAVDHLEGWDLPLARAARLSATFPFVSPAARPVTREGDAPLIDREPFNAHLVDGAYYDNYGIATLIDVVDSGLMLRQRIGRPLPPRIVVLRIEASAEGRALTRAHESFQWQTYAPLKALLQVRDAAQRIRGQSELSRLIHRWAYHGVSIREVRAVFPVADVPLSWRLTYQQSRSLRSPLAEKVLTEASRQMQDPR